MPEKKLKKLRKDLILAIDWAAAEYKYLEELKEELKKVELEREIKKELKELKKAVKILYYVARAERRAYRFEERAEKKLAELLPELQQEGISAELILGFREVASGLELEHDQLVKLASFYEGTLEKELDQARVEARLEEKLREENPAKTAQVHQAFLELVHHFSSQVDEAEKWIAGLEVTLKKAKELLMQVPPDKRRYLQIMNKIKPAPPKGIIDIFDTPLLFRYDYSVLNWLELERTGRFISSSLLVGNILNKPPPVESILFFFQTALPFSTRKDVSVEEIVAKLEMYFKTKDSGELHGDELDDLQRQFSNLDGDTFKWMLTEATALGSHTSHKAGPADEEGRLIDFKNSLLPRHIKQSQDFLRKVLADRKAVDIWLFLQKVALKLQAQSMFYKVFGTMLQLNSNITLLVTPKRVELFTIRYVQSHGDFLLEILALRSISVKDIVGVRKGSGISRQANEDLSTSLSEEVESLFILPYPYSNINRIIQGYNPPGDSSWTHFTLKEVCSYLHSIARYHGTNYSDLVQALQVQKDFPETMKWDEVEKILVPKSLKNSKLRQLFPDHDFSADSMKEFQSQFQTVVEEYIREKFKIDLQSTSVEYFIGMIVKRLGIPIYDKDGNLIWPQE